MWTKTTERDTSMQGWGSFPPGSRRERLKNNNNKKCKESGNNCNLLKN